MWLYHGTYDMFYRDIKKSGKLVPGLNRDTYSKSIDNIINIVAQKEIRKPAVYFSSDSEAMEAFDRSIRVSTKNLDLTKLYVADNNAANDIIGALNSNTGIKEAVAKYLKSYMRFDRYLRNQEKYHELYYPEFLYYGEVALPTRTKRS